MGLKEDLFKAARDRNRLTLKNIVRTGVDVNTENVHGRTPLFVASLNGHYEICDILLKHGARVNASQEHGSSPLQAAALEGHDEVVRLLLKRGANVNQKNSANSTSLHFASMRNHVGVVSILLCLGADVNAAGYGKKTALHWAAEAGFDYLVQCLLKDGARTDVLDDRGETPLDLAKRNQRDKIVDIFEINYPLYEASLNGRYELCQRFLVDVFGTSYELNPISVALEEEHTDIVNLFLHDQLDISYENIAKELPAIYLATDRGHKDVVYYLLDRGADPDTVVNGDSLLHVATRQGRSDLVSRLMSEEANPNIVDRRGFTPLHYAVMYGYEAIVAHLLSSDWETCADVNAQAPNQDTPLHMAFAGVHYNIVQILLLHGADMEALNDEDNTPLCVLHRKWAEFHRITDLTRKFAPPKKVEAASNQPSLDINHDEAGSTEDVSDSDDESATSPSLNDLKTKIRELLPFVLDTNDIATGVRKLQTAFARETEGVANLQRTVDNQRHVVGPKSKSKLNKVKSEDASKILSAKQDELKSNESKMKDEMKTLQKNIRDLYDKIKIIDHEIGKFV